jgi:site-specific recombinase XerD
MASIIKVGEKWRALIRRAGFSSACKTFPTKQQAVKWAREIESGMDSGLRHGHGDAKHHALASIIDRYAAEFPLGRSAENVIKHLRSGLGHYTLATLTAEAITKYVMDRGYGPATAQVEMAVLGRMLRIAKSVWGMPVSDAMADARNSLKISGKVKKSRARDRRPSLEELEKLKAWFDTKSTLPMRDIIDFAVATAMRAGEITRLRWADLDEEQATIIIRDRKDPKEKIGNHQTVPLLADALAIIKRQPRDGEFIFPFKEATFSSIFPRACQALEIDGLRFHDLRHEGASRLFEKGYQIQEVAMFTGHADWSMLKRYTQLKASTLRRL